MLHGWSVHKMDVTYCTLKMKSLVFIAGEIKKNSIRKMKLFFITIFIIALSAVHIIDVSFKWKELRAIC